MAKEVRNKCLVLIFRAPWVGWDVSSTPYLGHVKVEIRGGLVKGRYKGLASRDRKSEVVIYTNRSSWEASGPTLLKGK